MSLRINQNIPAMNAYNNLATDSNQMSKSLERLSSGFRINRADDDAAGLSVSEGLRAQIGGLKVAVKNAQDGINVVQTAEGAMNEVHSILQRMRDLSVQASNAGSQDTSARTAAQSEVTQLNAELDRIGGTTRFGGQSLLQGTPAAVSTSAVSAASVATATGAGTTTFTLGGSVNGHALGAVTVPQAPTAGGYTSAAAYQTALQSGIDTMLTGAGASTGSIQAKVTDNGAGNWTVALSSASVGNG